jgi:hypothetical protein
LQTVYEHLEDWQGAPFPVRRHDCIAEVYGIVGEDLDDLYVDLLEQIGCSASPEFVTRPIITVEDLVFV